jgi:hypothetical protein
MLLFIFFSKLALSCATGEGILQKKLGDTTSPDNPRHITLDWRTESEEENYGFNVYKSESEKGPFTKVNKKVIPGAGTTSIAHDYIYKDYAIKKGETYYYYLESVSLSGEKEKFSPVISVTYENDSGNEAKEEGKTD